MKWGKFELEFIHTPGHTKGSVCILEKKSGVLFSGDTLFADGNYGRTDLLGGSQEQMDKSLALLKTIDYKVLCPGHGRIEKR
jgi:glyoxylase-like metal-dependent hydrolase (beta-lactamase superfamily II)